MAIMIFFFQVHLCKAAGISPGCEHGVIAETLLACRRGKDVAITNSFEEVLLSIHYQGDDGAEAGPSIGLSLQPV